ncbi:ACT domain-containing protein [Secundilactobacillus kimchicus]|uniref:ACT domain-containing protein n=1 Tax=Secundilactobacillus kimchicus TaxID=528209 RepID=UPI000705280F|nr:ACT domain-containing protein [Secundilactobacillus kimchicus]MBT9672281.1 ACT domain-containing protein [Secundilactobacillus kimchicus]
MKAIITVVGQDQVGIVARVASQLAELKVNIIDISQTLMHGSFTMILMGEWDGEQQSFDRIKTALADLGQQLGLDIRMQRQELFDAIQKL